MNNTEQTHHDYIKKMGKFPVACNHIIFRKEELELLEQYGYWFEALSNGTLSPLNLQQEQFIEVARMERKPQTEYEEVWFRYIMRKKIEAEKGSILYTTPLPSDDTFYSRDMAKNLKNEMFRLTQENHRTKLK
jgi:uncharacterized protein YifE (UPF0438 family)